MEGWLSTGAIMTGSTAMARANPPVRHIPTAPTPGPPHVVNSWLASSRRKRVMGLVFPRASVANSRLTQARAISAMTYDPAGWRPGVPKRCGITAVIPRSATFRANAATRGVIPGISWITMTAGPAPTR